MLMIFTYIFLQYTHIVISAELGKRK